MADYYAVGQCTPGVIAVNTATFVGYNRAGILGGLLATMGVILPSVVIIAVIAAFLQNFVHIPAVAHAFAGIRACVVALILSSVLRLAKSTVIDLPSAVIFTVVLLLAALFGLSPVLLVAASGLCGLALRRIRGWSK